VSWEEHKAWGLGLEDFVDKNKADGLVKLAALCQVVWFTLQAVTRAAHGLPLASLETMTLAYVFNAIVTYGFWWEKPKDIATATFVDLPEMTDRQWQAFESLAMEETYDVLRPGERQRSSIAWYVVARDCRDDEVLVMATGIGDHDGDTEANWPRQSRMPSSKEESGIATRVEEIVKAPHVEWTKVITEWDANLYMTKWWPLLCLLGASFGAIHLLSWSSRFPTVVEVWLWRGSAVVSIVTAVICMQFRTMALTWDGPSTIVKVASPLLYIVSRIIMVIEAFTSLRAMEAGTYQTYVVWNYWFHFEFL
jgi:hypothetical protein